MLKVYLQKGKEKAIRMGHPWVFSGAIVRAEGDKSAGALCEVYAGNGEKLGVGYHNESSTIRVRMLTHHKEIFDDTVLGQRIIDAIDRRNSMLTLENDSCRYVNSEGDCLPGLIVDKYGNGLCIQILTAGMERFRDVIIEVLQKHINPAFVFERSDTDSRAREGLPEKEGLLLGKLPHHVCVKENNLLFNAHIATGQKTGLFLDQRENRKLFSEYAMGKTICDCFSYSGGFSVYGLAAKALHSTAVDISKTAIEVTKENLMLNGFSPDQYECVTADVFDYLRKETRRFDCIVLDPPKFAKHKGEVDKAARGYKDINLLACKLIEKNGIIFTFSCSQAIDPYLFRQIVFSAAADSNRQVQVLHVLGAASDHPFTIAHREGEYLKGLVLRVL